MRFGGTAEPNILRMARQVCKRYRERRDHEDIVSECCLHAVRVLRDRPGCPCKVLFKAMHRRAVQYIRDESRRDLRFLPRHTDRRVASHRTLLRLIVAEELEVLTPRQRDILYRSYWLGQTPTEIAADRGCRKQTVATLKDRLMQRLRERFGSLDSVLVG